MWLAVLICANLRDFLLLVVYFLNAPFDCWYAVN